MQRGDECDFQVFNVPRPELGDLLHYLGHRPGHHASSNCPYGENRHARNGLPTPGMDQYSQAQVWLLLLAHYLLKKI